MAVYERKIEESRDAADVRVRTFRMEVAEERERRKLEVAEKQASFQRQLEGLTRDLQEHSAACREAVAAAGEHRRHAEEASQGAWQTSDRQMKASSEEAGRLARQGALGGEEACAEADRRLAALEEEFQQSLRTIQDREAAARADHTADARAAEVRAALAQEVSARREACRRFAQRCDEDIAGLAEELRAAGAEAAKRAWLAREAADREVLAALTDMERFAEGRHCSRIVELQAQLNSAVFSARKGLERQDRRLREDITRQADEATSAVVMGDLRVSQLRDCQSIREEQRSRVVDQDLRAIHVEQEALASQEQQRLHVMQRHMVEYMGSQMDDMLELLDTTEPTRIPPRLHFSGAVA